VIFGKVSSMTTKSRVAGTFMGLAVGDALGSPLEKCEPGSFEFVSEMSSGGLYDLPPGAWTDETATALCLAQSLLVTHELNVYDLVERFKRWVESGENSSTGVCIGIEQSLLRFVGNFERTQTIESSVVNQKATGNSVLARVAPIACIHWDDLEVASKIAKQQSYLTHISEVVAAASECLVLSLSHLIAGRSWNYVCNMPIKDDWPLEIELIVKGQWRHKTIENLKSTKDPVDILEASFWCVGNSNSFEDAVTKAINLGGNSDTLGAVVGQLAGAAYGVEAIPVRWYDQLLQIEKLTDVAMQMVELSRTE
jgi:ADP-ribosylglycohydrolase